MRSTVAVTTTADRFGRWAEPLERHGFEPVSLPCIEIQPTARLDEARTEATEADWLMLTSSRVVDLLWPGGDMPSVPVAVVGEATAAAVRAAGGTVTVTGDGDGDRLVDLLLSRVRRDRVVAPHGHRADVGRHERLRRAGADVVAVAVYETAPTPPGPEPVDGAVFASPSSVEGWSLSRSFQPLERIGSIGMVTAAALRRHGVESPIVGERPTPERLVAAMSASLERTS